MSSNIIHIQYYSLAVLVLFSVLSSFEAQLQEGFYSKSCPSAETIVKQTVTQAINSDQGIAPGLVRMHFHDCFVRGCDGSILIDSTSNNIAEKESSVNNPSLRGFEVIDKAKTMLEAQCKGVVSCADIIPSAARDSIALVNGPSYSVPAGRKDGRVSLASEVHSNIPTPNMDVSQITRMFGNKGLTQEEMVTLLGFIRLDGLIAQSNDRLYNFNGTHAPDPTLNSAHPTQLQQQYPQGSTDTTSVVPIDPTTPLVLDSNYYSHILANRGLFTSDSTLRNNAATAAAVSQNANNQSIWFNKLTATMVKTGQIGAGSAGEIRSNCRAIN